MSKASQYIILCEDALHSVFVHRFLRKCDVPNRIIKTIPPPVGKGCGEHHVRTKYPNEIMLTRARQSKARTVLIVVIDADTDIIENRQSQLTRTAEDAKIKPRSNDESIVHLIPKRHIETWLAFLDNVSDVNETEEYKAKYEFCGKESESHQLVDKFREMFLHRQLPPDNLPSMNQAFQELERLRQTLTRS